MTDQEARQQPRRTVVQELLIEGLVDYLDPGWIHSACVDANPLSSLDSIRHEAWGVVTELLFGGMVTLGSIDRDGVFVEHTQALGEQLETFCAAWMRRWGDEAPDAGDPIIGVFRNTARGDESARSTLAAE